ncbi:MAG: hypothetical protein GX139_06685 [Armatimonadetes bacterium]|nr:hypothetical protein [Armatimonadota bacterium]
MTGFSSSRDDLVASLRAYTTHLSAQHEALQQLSSTTSHIRETLDAQSAPDISDDLVKRQNELEKYTALCEDAAQDESLIDAALDAANCANEELNAIARSIITIREDSRSLAEEIIHCQAECESLLKQRLQATSDAIRRSAQRRKLDAAYGPAVSHEIPTFMDKQQ